MDVLSLGLITAATKADLGAPSIEAVEARNMKKTRARGKELGTGIKARKIEEGRCVNTIVLTLPIRFAREDATSIERAETKLVVKKTFPSCSSGRENLVLKKYAIQVLCIPLSIKHQKWRARLTVEQDQTQRNQVRTTHRDSLRLYGSPG